MPQISLYLDEETKQRMVSAAHAAGLSQSRWLAQLIREKTADEWPNWVAELAGAWSDLPTADELRADLANDLPRERF